MSRSAWVRTLRLRPKDGNDALPDPAPPQSGARQSTLTDQVHEILTQQIVQRHLTPGSRLDVGDLARRLGVSRMPIVDALNRLEMEGLIDRRDRVGSFVTPLSPAAFNDLFEARLMVEQWSVPHVIERLTTKDRKLLHGMLRESGRLLRNVDDRSFDYRRTLEIDQAFHLTLMSIAGNQRILAWYRSLNAHIQIGRVYSMRALERCQGAQREHEALLAALEAGDARRARQAIKHHLDVSRKGVLAILQERGDL